MRRLALLAAAAALSCSGLNTKLCGGQNQPCCAEGPACEATATCPADGTCPACGGEGQACCTGDTCHDGFGCAGAVCSSSGCAGCAPGTSRCNGTGGVEACVGTATCAGWTAQVTTCPSGSVCQASGTDAVCASLCPVACVPDSLQCTVLGLRRCVVAPGASCPTLQPEPDLGDLPQCVTGAQVGTDLVWESPTPLNTPLVGIAGELVDSYWVLDSLGNIIHDVLGSWEYEVRGVPGKRARAIFTCGLGSRLYAAGEGGTVYVRGYGGWTEENVGAAVTLEAIACDSALNALATGSDGRLYLRTGAGWTSYATGSTGPFHGLGYDFSSQKVYLVGGAGSIVRCDNVGATPTCAAETSHTTATLVAAWGDTFTSHVFAAGAGGTLLERTGLDTWGALDTVGTTGTVQAVSGFYDSASGRSVVVAVGDQGAYLSRPYTVMYLNSVAPEVLTGVMAQDLTHVFVASAEGNLWFTNQVSPPIAATFTAAGGKKPITQTLRGLSSLGLGRLFAVGDNGSRYRRENGAWLPDSAGLSVTEALESVVALSDAEVYAVGAGGRVLVRRYGLWADDAPGLVQVELTAVAADANTLYAVGAGGAWLEKARRGGQWKVINTGVTTQTLSALALTVDGTGAALEVVAVGAECTVVSKTTTGFALLPAATCPAGTSLSAAAYTSAGDLTVAGSGAVVLRRNTTGFTREYLDASSQETVRALVPQGTSLWALTEAGHVYRRATGWTEYAPYVTSRDLLAGVVDRDEGLFIAGSNGLVWKKP